MPIIVFAIFVLIKDYFQYIYSWKLNREGYVTPFPIQMLKSVLVPKGFLKIFWKNFTKS